MVSKLYGLITNKAVRICFNDNIQFVANSGVTEKSTKILILRELSAAIDFFLLEITRENDLSKVLNTPQAQDFIKMLALMKKSSYHFNRTISGSEPIFNEHLNSYLKLNIWVDSSKKSIQTSIMFKTAGSTHYTIVSHNRMFEGNYRFPIFLQNLAAKIDETYLTL